MSDNTDEQKPSERLSEIFAKMNMSELPAMSHNVQELISLTCSSRSAANELSRVILKDYSLTNKVLQVVNSAYYSLGRPVNSISRAVTVLGFDAVRDLATGIALFEEFIKSGVDKDSISKLLTRSFLSALQARDLAVEKNIKVAPEEAFICTLLQNLGKIIVCIYLPDAYREIEALMDQGMDIEKASKAVLKDITFREIGEEVAKFWNLSEKVLVSMAPNPAKPKSQYDSDGYLQNLASFSNQLVNSICDGTNLGPLMKQYGDILSVDGEEAVAQVMNCVEVSEDISDSIRYGLSKLKIRGKLKTMEDNAKKGVWTSVKPEEAKKKAAQKAALQEDSIGIKSQRPTEIEELDELPLSKDKSVDDFIRDITETLMGNFDLNSFYANLLEGLYRGIGFDRVLMGILNMQQKRAVLIGRFGLGDIDSASVKKFEHDIALTQYVIPKCLKTGKDMMIPANKPHAFPASLDWLVKDRFVYLFPISLDNKPIGLIYLDRKKGRPLLDKAKVKSVRLFRDFAVMAIRKIRKKQ